jgi:hypothetical protein
MNLTKGSILSISVICFWVFASCGNSNAVNKQEKSSNTAVGTSNPDQPVALSGNSSKIQAELEKAKKEGKAVFVVVTGAGVTETDKATAIANGAKAIYKKSLVVQLNRDDAANSQLVAEWRLAGAPLPLVLVVSPKGMLTGGRLLSQATAENIAALVPSPKKGEVLEQLADGKSVFLLVSKKSMSQKSKQLSTCQQACNEMQEMAKVIEIDLDDPIETAFLSELKINRNISGPTTYVINSSGQITGTFNGELSTTALVASARKVISSGCCSPGSGKTCAPAK